MGRRFIWGGNNALSNPKWEQVDWYCGNYQTISGDLAREVIQNVSLIERVCGVHLHRDYARIHRTLIISWVPSWRGLWNEDSGSIGLEIACVRSEEALR